VNALWGPSRDSRKRVINTVIRVAADDDDDDACAEPHGAFGPSLLRRTYDSAYGAASLTRACRA